MKKLATLGLTALLAFGLVGCKKEDPAAEYKKFQAWQQSQEQVQQTAQAEFQTKLAAFMQSEQKDPKVLNDLLNGLSTRIQESVKSLDSVDVKSAEVKALKDKTKALLTLSTDVLAEQTKVLVAPSEEAQKAVQAKAAQLQQSVVELQKLQADLQAKFGEKPAEQAPAQPAPAKAEEAKPAEAAK